MVQNRSIDTVISRLEKFLADRDWEKFHDPKNLAMSISIEAAELMELFQWQTNREAAHDSIQSGTKQRVNEELADVMLYCLSLARVLDIDVVEAMMQKIDINCRRYPVNKCKGIAKKYDALD